MNIFNVLERGHSSLREVNFTALLSYFLDPNEDHGLGDQFTKLFLDKVDENLDGFLGLSSNLNNYEIEVIPEYKLIPQEDRDYQDNNKIGYIDILIKITNKKNNHHSHCIAIENKIDMGAADENQLINYTKLIENNFIDDQINIAAPTKLLICYITPDIKNAKADCAFDKVLDSEYRQKIRFFWSNKQRDNDEVENQTIDIKGMIQELLTITQKSKASSLDEYISYTLQSFANYLETNEKLNKTESQIKERNKEYESELIEKNNIKSIFTPIIKEINGMYKGANLEHYFEAPLSENGFIEDNALEPLEPLFYGVNLRFKGYFKNFQITLGKNITLSDGVVYTQLKSVDGGINKSIKSEEFKTIKQKLSEFGINLSEVKGNKHILLMLNEKELTGVRVNNDTPTKITERIKAVCDALYGPR